jgi:hypothetical protein
LIGWLAAPRDQRVIVWKTLESFTFSWCKPADGVLVALGQGRARIFRLTNAKAVSLAILLVSTLASIAGGLVVNGDGYLLNNSISKG